MKYTLVVFGIFAISLLVNCIDSTNNSGADYIFKQDVKLKTFVTKTISTNLIDSSYISRKIYNFSGVSKLLVGKFGDVSSNALMSFKFDSTLVDSLNFSSAQLRLWGLATKDLGNKTLKAFITKSSWRVDTADAVTLLDSIVISDTCNVGEDTGYVTFNLRYLGNEINDAFSRDTVLSLRINFIDESGVFVKRFLSVKAEQGKKPQIFLHYSNSEDTLYAVKNNIDINSPMCDSLQLLDLVADRSVFCLSNNILYDSIPEDAVVSNSKISFFIKPGSLKKETSETTDSIFCALAYNSSMKQLLNYGLKSEIENLDSASVLKIDITDFMQRFQNERKKDDNNMQMCLILEYRERDDLFVKFGLKDSASVTLTYSIE